MNETNTDVYALQTFDGEVEYALRFCDMETYTGVSNWVIGRCIQVVDRDTFERFARSLKGYWYYRDGRIGWFEL